MFSFWAGRRSGPPRVSTWSIMESSITTWDVMATLPNKRNDRVRPECAPGQLCNPHSPHSLPRTPDVTILRMYISSESLFPPSRRDSPSEWSVQFQVGKYKVHNELHLSVWNLTLSRSLRHRPTLWTGAEVKTTKHACWISLLVIEKIHCCIWQTIKEIFARLNLPTSLRSEYTTMVRQLWDELMATEIMLVSISSSGDIANFLSGWSCWWSCWRLWLWSCWR